MLVWPRKIEKHIFKALEALKLQSLAWAPKSPKVSSIHKKGSALISCNGMHLKSPSPKKYGVVTPFSSLLSLDYIQYSFSKIFRLTKNPKPHEFMHEDESENTKYWDMTSQNPK